MLPPCVSIYPDPLECSGFEGENLDESDHVILGKRKASPIDSDDSKTHIVDLSNSDNTLPIYPDPLEGSGYEGDNLDEFDLVILGKRKALSFESDEISEDPKSQPLLTPRKGCRPGFIPLFTRKVYAKKALAAAEAYEHEQAIEKIRNVINTIRNSDDSNNDVGDKSNDEANQHQESTTHESFLPSPIYENIPELEKVKKHIFGSYKNPAKWPKRDEHGINEFTQKYLLAACFPTLFPYGVGDFTGNLPIPVSIDQARKYYEKYAEYNSETETIEYPFAQHPFFSFYMLNRAHRHTLLSASNVFLRNSPSYNNMTIEQLLDHIKNHTKSLLAMGIGRYEANAKGSAGFWHIAGQELKAAINEICFPTLFYSFSFADNWNTELFNILPFPKGMSRDSYNDRKKVLTNNLHLAAWFYYRKATEFSIQMRKVLQAEWNWERVEAQFRTSLHTHVCLKMHTDK